MGLFELEDMKKITLLNFMCVCVSKTGEVSVEKGGGE